MRDDLVQQHSGVVLEVHQVDGQRGHLGDHDSAQRVGHADVRVRELELDVVGLHVQDVDGGVSVVGHGV